MMFQPYTSDLYSKTCVVCCVLVWLIKFNFSFMLLLGIEVKAGQPVKTNPGANYVIHLSQVRGDLLVES